MDKNWVEEEDLTWQSPDSLLTSKKRKISQDAVYWVNMGRAQRKGLEFFRTRSNAIILYITLPSIYIERVMSWKTEEILKSRTKSPRPPPTMTLKNNWRQKENSGKNATSHEQPSQPSQVQSTGKPATFKSQAEVDPQNMEDVQKNDEEIDQQSTWKPVLAFRVQGLPHSEVKEAEIGRVRGLIGQIENHPNQKDLQEDLSQNNVYNPFSENSKKMVREMGHVEYFELCASDPALQRSCCLTYWAEGIVFCTCGIRLTHTEETQRRNTKNFDLMSIPNFVIKKRVSHGAGHGKSEEQHLCFKSYNAWKRCRKHQDESGQNFAGILDRFQRDPENRKSQEELGWTEALWKEMVEKLQEDHTYTLARAERLRYKSTWSLALKSSGKNCGSLASRPDFHAAVALKDHLYRKSEDYQPPIPPQDADRLRKDNKFSETYHQGPRVDETTGWKFWPSSSSSSVWRQSDKWDW